jgi:predicted transcriptional regulator
MIRWKTNELLILRNNYKEKTITQLSNELDRSYKSVARKMARMGYRKYGISLLEYNLQTSPV